MDRRNHTTPRLPETAETWTLTTAICGKTSAEQKSKLQTVAAVWLRDAVACSRRRDCQFDDTPCLSLLEHLIKLQGGVIK